MHMLSTSQKTLRELPSLHRTMRFAMKKSEQMTNSSINIDRPLVL